jgi:aminomethyltransferase
MVPFSGFEMPVQYQNLKDEVLAVRQHCGMFDVSHMGEFWVTGTDALSFVDSIVTNDIFNAPTGKAIYALLLNQDAKILDDLIVYKLSHDKILICVNAGNIEKDWEWILSQKGQFQCELTNKSEETSLIALQGPESEKHLIQILKNTEISKMEYYSVIEMSFQNEVITIARTGYTGEDGFEIFASHKSIQNLWNLFLNNGVKPCGLGARDVLRLEVCYPLYGHELNEKLNPYDVGLKWPVKINKKYFVGQNILKNYTSTKSLIKISLEKGIPRADYAVIQNNQIIGVITSGTMSVVTGKGIALALIDKNKFKENDSLFVDIRGNQFPAELNKKPFVSGGHK